MQAAIGLLQCHFIKGHPVRGLKPDVLSFVDKYTLYKGTPRQGIKTEEIYSLA